MHKTVVSQELLSAKVVKVSSLPFFSCCKVAVIRGVFHQEAGSVIIPIGVLKNHPVTLYNVMQSRKRTGSEREAYLNEKLLSCCFRLSKPSPYPQGQQLNKCLYGGCLPFSCRNLVQLRTF